VLAERNRVGFRKERKGWQKAMRRDLRPFSANGLYPRHNRDQRVNPMSSPFEESGIFYKANVELRGLEPIVEMSLDIRT
jgi:hypothetical protein